MKLVEKSLKRWRRGKLPLCIAIALCRIAELHEKRKKKSNKVLLLLTPIIILLVLCTASFSENWMRQQREEENCSVNNCPEEYMNGNKLSEAFYICAESGLEKLLLYRIMNRNARSRLLQFPLSLFIIFPKRISALSSATGFLLMLLLWHESLIKIIILLCNQLCLLGGEIISLKFKAIITHFGTKWKMKYFL